MAQNSLQRKLLWHNGDGVFREDRAQVIHAELHGKLNPTARLSVAERWEDVLTSSVFGLLRFLPVEVTCRFLMTAERRREELMAQGAGRHSLRLDLGCVAAIETHFWPHFAGWTREPDVVLDLWEAGGRLHRRVVVEAKYGSPKSQGQTENAELGMVDPRVSGDQLADQLACAWHDRHPGVHPPALVFLTAEFTYPRAELAESVKMLSRSHIPPEVYWTAWWKLAPVLHELYGSSPKNRVAADLLALLERRGQTTLCRPWSRTLVALSPWRFEGKAAVALWKKAVPPLARSPWRFCADRGGWFRRTTAGNWQGWGIDDE